MRCTKCGAEIKQNKNFCMYCGEKMPSPENLRQEYNIPQKPIYPKPKKDCRELRLRLLQTLFGVSLAAFMFFFSLFQNSISIMTTGVETYNDSKFPLFHIIDSLVHGTERYNPSVLSIVMGAGVFIFVFASSAFWLFSASATLIRKGEKGMRRISVILTFSALGSACALPHLAYLFVSQFRYAYARTVGVLPEDMSGVSTIFLSVWTGIAVLLLIATWVVAAKRHELKGKADENEK